MYEHDDKVMTVTYKIGTKTITEHCPYIASLDTVKRELVERLNGKKITLLDLASKHVDLYWMMRFFCARVETTMKEMNILKGFYFLVAED